MPTDPRSAAAVGRLYEALREALRQRPGGRGATEVTVSEIYQTLVPYARARADLGFEMNADYEHALMRLLAGEGGHARLEQPEARAQLTRELGSANPDVTLYRRFAASTLRLAEPIEASVPPSSPARLDTRGVVEAGRAALGEGAGAAASWTPARLERRGSVADDAGSSGAAAASGEASTTAAGRVADADAEATATAAEGRVADADAEATATAATGRVADADAGASTTAAAGRVADADAEETDLEEDAPAEDAAPRRAAPSAFADPASAPSAALSWSQALDRIAKDEPPAPLDEATERALDDGLARLSSVLQGRDEATRSSEARPAVAPSDAPDAPPEGVADAEPRVTRGPPGTLPDECGSCGKALPADRDVRFCPYCGSEQPRVCGGCGDSLEDDWRFCPACGTEV